MFENEFREACGVGNADAVSFYLKRNPLCLNHQHPMNGWTGLHWAVHRNHLHIVKLLLSHADCDPPLNFNLKNSTGQTAVDLAYSSFSSNPEIKALLQEFEEMFNGGGGGGGEDSNELKNAAPSNIGGGGGAAAAADEDNKVESTAKATTTATTDSVPGFIPSYIRNPDLSKVWLTPEDTGSKYAFSRVVNHNVKTDQEKLMSTTITTAIPHPSNCSSDSPLMELLVMIEVSRLQLFPQNNEYSSSSSLLVPLKDICVGAIHIFDPNERILTLKQKIKHQLLTDFNLYPFAITAASATSTSEFDDENKTNNTSMFSKLKSSLRALIAKQDIESLRLYRKSTRYGLDIPIGAGQNDTMVIHHYGENDKNDNNDNNYIIYISPYNKEGRW